MQHGRKIDRRRKRGLADVAAQSLRQLVADGVYAPGETLPSFKVLAERLGVSMRIIREAVATLSGTGLLKARRGAGTVVCDTAGRLWRGCVLFIVEGDGSSYYYLDELKCGIRRRLMQSGYLCAHVLVPPPSDGNDARDMSELDAALEREASFAMLLSPRIDVLRRIERAKIPYLVMNGAPRRNRLCRGHVCVDVAEAFSSFASACRDARIRSILAVSFVDSSSLLRCDFSETGASVERWIISPVPAAGILEGVSRAAMGAFLDRFGTRSGRTRLPDMIFFADDFTARGALTALIACGVRIPRDVSIVTLSNVGFPPLAPCRLARFEFAPRAYGDAVALDILATLDGGPIPVKSLFCAYVPDESFPS